MIGNMREGILLNMQEIVKLYLILRTYKDFYQRFRVLGLSNALCFINLLSCIYESNFKNKFIKFLKQDWEVALMQHLYL